MELIRTALRKIGFRSNVNIDNDVTIPIPMIDTPVYPEPEPPPESILNPVRIKSYDDLLPQLYDDGFPVSFLTHSDSDSDIGRFYDFMVSSKYAVETIQRYVIYMRKWKKELQGVSVITSEQIQRVLDRTDPQVSVRLLTTLRTYAHYRRDWCADPRLGYVLSANLKIRREAIQHVKQRGMSKIQAQVYWGIARKLCRQNNRDGIFIALSLLKIKASEMSAVEISSKSVQFFRGKKNKRAVIIPIPDWLSFAMLNNEQWRIGRQTVHRRLTEYDTNNQVLCNADFSLSDCGSGTSRITGLGAGRVLAFGTESSEGEI